MNIPLSRVAAILWVGIASLAAPRPAAADTMFGAESKRSDYVPFDELSYEVIIEPGLGHDIDVRIRVALHNTSARAQDIVLNLGLPRGSKLRGLSVARDGHWAEGKITSPKGIEGRRDPGTLYARFIAPNHARALPSAEIVGFNLDSGATTQFELHLELYADLVNDRWQIELPRRNSSRPNFSQVRRVMVRGLRDGESFKVESVSSGHKKHIESNAEDTVDVSWPAHLRGGPTLDGRYDLTADTDGRGGDIRLTMHLGQDKAAKPDHLILVVDHSTSTSARLQRDALTMFSALMDALPEDTTFDAIAFHRFASPLLRALRSDARNDAALRDLRQALKDHPRAQGSDLRAALSLAGERLAKVQARHPMIVIVSDGMLPRSLDPKVIREILHQHLGKKRLPEMLFVVDDPLLARHGLPSSHPIAALASGLGARISLSALANLKTQDLNHLLSAPRVLGELAVALPKQVSLLGPMPTGLVAGTLIVLEGRYQGRPPTSLTIAGRLGRKKHSARIRPHRHAAFPLALVASTEPKDLKRAAQEGLNAPPWYSASMRRQAKENIDQASATGFESVGQLDASIIRRSLRFRVLPRARTCFNQALAHNQVQGGRVSLTMEVGKGEVMYAAVARADLERPDPKFRRCLEEAAWALRVPAGQLDTQVYMVRYPLKFTAPKGGHPPSAGEDDDPIFRMLMKRADVLSQ